MWVIMLARSGRTGLICRYHGIDQWKKLTAMSTFPCGSLPFESSPWSWFSSNQTYCIGICMLKTFRIHKLKGLKNVDIYTRCVACMGFWWAMHFFFFDFQAPSLYSPDSGSIRSRPTRFFTKLGRGSDHVTSWSGSLCNPEQASSWAQPLQLRETCQKLRVTKTSPGPLSNTFRRKTLQVCITDHW